MRRNELENNEYKKKLEIYHTRKTCTKKHARTYTHIKPTRTRKQENIHAPQTTRKYNHKKMQVNNDTKTHSTTYIHI